MWPFKKRPAGPIADPIGDICRSLAERWWEWKDIQSEQRPSRPGLQHISGTILFWATEQYGMTGTRLYVWLGMPKGQSQLVEGDEAERLYCDGIRAQLAARVSNTPFQFTAAAKQLAAAVQAEQLEAAYGIIDEILEHHPRPQ